MKPKQVLPLKELENKRLFSAPFEVRSRQSSIGDNLRVTELQAQVATLTDQTHKLAEEVSFYRDRYLSTKEQEQRLTQLVRQLERELEDKRVIRSDSDCRPIRKIEKNYAKLMASITSLQERTLKVVEFKNQQYVDKVETRYTEAIQQAQAQMQVQLDVDKEREVVMLQEQLDSLQSKLLFYEELNASLLRENQQAKAKMQELTLENEGLLTALTQSKLTRASLPLLHTPAKARRSLGVPPRLPVSPKSLN